jgi:hypothetical protein
MKVSPKTFIADGPTETLEAGKKRFAGDTAREAVGC